MQIQTELRPMFSYSFIPIIIISIIAIIILVLVIITKEKKKKKKPVVILPSQRDLMALKKKYLNIIKELENNYNSKKITNRKAYQTLSQIIRNFIFESTNIKVHNYTLKEIKEVNMPILYELVSEYYDPEFAILSEGNITSSINKTKAVIERWN